MGKRERLDLLLVQRELVTSREEGRRRILAAEVLVNERPLTKAGALVDQTAAIRLKTVSPYVSRGGFKLEKALRQFQIDVKDKVALDVGASTGGFTHCLISHGARRVYSVDCGYGQLDW
jgi:23S rRNA (cytidine1920-2'-O)/16S rRNA (cytidine1409-2'-O)-methyltransferase